MIFTSTAGRQNKPFYEQNLSMPNFGPYSLDEYLNRLWYKIKFHCYGETSRNLFVEAVKNEGEDNLHSVIEKARNSASHKKRLLLQIGGEKRARFSV